MLEPTMKTRYHAFLDESGQRDYGPRTDRYFVVAGAIARCENCDTYEIELCGVKRAFFGSPYVEIKSRWLRHPGERKKRYLDTYGISQAKLETFVEALYDWLCSTRITIIAGVVDKKQMEARYTYPHSPSAVGYHIFLQRYQKFLASRHCAGAVTFDEISGTTRSKRKWQDLLVKQHKQLKTRGCRYTRTKFTNIENELTFSDSDSYSMIQIADIAAYNIFSQFRAYGKQWDDSEAKSLDLYDHFYRIMPRLHRDSSGVFDGYGIAKMPRQSYNRWMIPEDILLKKS